MHPPNRERPAKSASTCSGLKSPIRRAPSARWRSVTWTSSPKESPTANCANRRPAYGARGRGTIKRSLTRNGGGPASARLRPVARFSLGRLEDLRAVVGTGVDQFGNEGVRDLEIATAIG